MRIAFAGVSTSHPFGDAARALAAGLGDLVVWDADDPARRDAFGSRFDARPVDTLDELLATRPHLVITAPRTPRLAETIGRVLDSGAACFQHKVALPNLAALDALTDAVAGREARFLTASVLRFAPAVQALRSEIAGRRLLGVSITVRHDISDFLRPERRWVDDPEVGGGTAMTLGLHGWELASALLGERLEARGGVVAARELATASEDVALLSAVSASGVPVRVEVLGVATREDYRIRVETTEGTFGAAIDADDETESLGYVEAFEAALGLAAGRRSPIPWAVSRNVIETAVRAATLARRAAG